MAAKKNKPASFAVGNRRLLKLAQFLRTEVPRERFDYAVFTSTDAPAWPKGARPPLQCGTAACALGWATAIPSFRAAGLTLVAHGTYGVPTLGKAEDFAAGAALFGITYEESEHLFIPSDEEVAATPKQVAVKIERFVRDRVKARAR